MSAPSTPTLSNSTVGNPTTSIDQITSPLSALDILAAAAATQEHLPVPAPASEATSATLEGDDTTVTDPAVPKAESVASSHTLAGSSSTLSSATMSPELPPAVIEQEKGKGKGKAKATVKAESTPSTIRNVSGSPAVESVEKEETDTEEIKTPKAKAPTLKGKGKAKAKVTQTESKDVKGKGKKDTPLAEVPAVAGKKRSSEEVDDGSADNDGGDDDEAGSSSDQASKKQKVISPPGARKIPTCEAEFDTLDRLLVDLKNADKSWDEIRAEFKRVTGRTYPKSTLPNRYTRIKANLDALTFSDEDMTLLEEAKTEVEAQMAQEKWGRIKSKFDEKKPGVDFSVEVLRKQWEASEKKQ